MTDTPYLTIGAFSSQSRISVRMLRHYDEQGLLTPADVDPATGYRRYHPAQLGDAVRIRQLRDVGFTVSAIAAVLAAHGSDSYQRALLLQRDVLAGEARDAEHRLRLINRLITNEGQEMNDITIQRVSVPAQTIVGLRGTVPTYSDEGILWEQFMPALAAQGITPVGRGGVIEYDGEYRESDVDELVFVPVAPGTTVSAPLAVFEIGAREALVAKVVGPYSLISEAHTKLGEFARENGVTMVDGGPDMPIADQNWNIYVTDPSGQHEDAPVTEVYVPIAG